MEATILKMPIVKRRSQKYAVINGKPVLQESQRVMMRKATEEKRIIEAQRADALFKGLVKSYIIKQQEEALLEYEASDEFKANDAILSEGGYNTSYAAMEMALGYKKLEEFESMWDEAMTIFMACVYESNWEQDRYEMLVEKALNNLLDEQEDQLCWAVRTLDNKFNSRLF